ncbi:peptidase C39-like protein [Micromonospora pisi]|uniref:Peptidase C39-like protein n=1 Tax=Micromonospora pisi TaxID=589240 RepID=A0A495JDF8_9ACTN|nr:C39 family peptidase [Micromonospora pisi]RKR86945.1 peptidase C39-like protein [Micromonospora pisi]
MTAAGLAFVGGAIVGPLGATAQAAPAANPAPAMTTVAHVTSDKGHGDMDKGQDKDQGQDRGKGHAPSAKELKADYQAQPNFYWCGPASTRIALSADGHNLSQDEVAKKLGTTVEGTPSAEDTTRVLNDVVGGNVYKTTAIPDSKAKPEQMDKLQADVKHAIDDNRAVVANIIGTGTDTDGVSHSYEGGHYLAVIGYRDDGRAVKISDPANPNDPSYWMSTIDMANWIATRGYSA